MYEVFFLKSPLNVFALRNYFSKSPFSKEMQFENRSQVTTKNRRDFLLLRTIVGTVHDVLSFIVLLRENA